MASETILVVDGDTRSRKILDVSFRKSGYRVVMTETVEEALDALGDADPDLIISDTDLPDGDGFEFCKEVKDREGWEDVPFLFLTEEASLPNKIKGLEIGADDYLTRPIYIKEVTTRADVLLKKRDRRLLSEGKVEEFEGELSDITMIDLLQTIDEEERSGEIEFEREGRRATVTFRDGRVVDAICGKLRGEDAVYRLMLWPSGTFEVRYHDRVPKADHVDIPTDQLLIEGIEHLEAWNREIEKLPSLDRVFDADYRQLPELLDRVPEEVGRVIRLFDGYRSLREIVDDSPVDDVTAVRIIRRIFDEGVLEDVTPSPEKGASGRGASGETSHLDDWLESTKGKEEEDRTDEEPSESSEELQDEPSTSPGHSGGDEPAERREASASEERETGAEDLADALTRELDRGLDEADEMGSGPRYMPDDESEKAELATDRDPDSTIDELEEAERERRREEAKRLVEQKQDDDVAGSTGDESTETSGESEEPPRDRDNTPRAHPSQGGPIPDDTREGPAVPVDMEGKSSDEWELAEEPEAETSTGVGSEVSGGREEVRTADEGLQQISDESLADEASGGQGVPPSFQTVEDDEEAEGRASADGESQKEEGASDRRRPEAHERPASWTESGVDEGTAEEVRREAEEEPLESVESEETDEDEDDVRTSAERRAVSVDEAESVQDEAARAVREGAEEALEEADRRAEELDEDEEGASGEASSGVAAPDASSEASSEAPDEALSDAPPEETSESSEEGRSEPTIDAREESRDESGNREGDRRESPNEDAERDAEEDAKEDTQEGAEEDVEEGVEEDAEGDARKDLRAPATEEELRSTEEFPELEGEEEFPDLDVGDEEDGAGEIEDEVERVSNNRELVRVEYDLAKEGEEMVEKADSHSVENLAETTDSGIQEADEETMKARELLEGEEEEDLEPADESEPESDAEPVEDSEADADDTLPGAGGGGLEWEDEPTARDMDSWAEEHEEDDEEQDEESEKEQDEEQKKEQDEESEKEQEGEQDEEDGEREESAEESEDAGEEEDEDPSVEIGFASGEPPPEEKEPETSETLGDSEDEQEFFGDADEAEYSWDIDDEYDEPTSNWQWYVLPVVFGALLVTAWATGFGPFGGEKEQPGTPAATADEPKTSPSGSGLAGAGAEADAEGDAGDVDGGEVDTGPSRDEIVAKLENTAEARAMSMFSASQQIAGKIETAAEESTGGGTTTTESSGGRAASDEQPDQTTERTGGTEATGGGGSGASSGPSVGDQVEQASNLVSQGRFDEAKRILDEASERAPNNGRIAQLYLQLGSKFQGADDVGQAEASYRSYLEMKPSGEHADEVESILDRPPFSN